MFNFSPLYFPKIVFYKEVSYDTSPKKIEKAPEDSQYNRKSKKLFMTLFKLDWSQQEKKMEEKYYRWVNSCWSKFKDDPDVKFIHALPKKYDDIVKNFVFAISDDYLQEIQRNVWLAQEEFNIKRPFDTVIREMCYKPGEKAVEIAFKLLEDCVWDEKKNYFNRNRDLFWNLMVYKFWAHQIGRGLIWNFAGLDRYEKEVRKESDGEKEVFRYIYGDVKDVKECLDSIKEHYKLLDKSYSFFTKHNVFKFKVDKSGKKGKMILPI